MLYTAALLALLASEPRLVVKLDETLLLSAVSLCVVQTVRGIVSQGSDVYSAFLMAVLSVLLSPAMTIILVLFGAPVIISQAETALCGLLLSVLIIQPLLTLYGLDPETWRQIISIQLPFNSAYLGSVGGAIGAWAGAVPIALDWDRPWQTYPITIVLGAYAGSLAGNIIGMAYPAARVQEAKNKKKTKRVYISDKKPAQSTKA